MSKERKILLLKECLMLALSFLIPFVMLIIVLQVNKVALFNYSGKTIFMIDLESQYITYLMDYRNRLLNGGSLIYTNSKLFGGDYMSIYTYYLASPFNLLSVLFKEEAMPLFFIWTNILKMCFASLNMYLLCRLSSKFSYHKLIAAIGYGLISYSLIYISNYMWLDGVMILPLIILGLIYLKDNKHLWLYPLALFYALLTSWYIGFMIVIFIVLFFLVMFFSDFKLKNIANYKFLLRFAIFSLLGGMTASVFWFTSIIHLAGTKGTTSIPQASFYSISVFFTGFMENNYVSTSMISQNHDYASMFVGVVPLVFFVTYFFNKEHSIKERILFLLVVMFYLFATIHSSFYALNHGGREPTWFPTRFSFVIGFLVCYLADRSLDHAKELHPLYYLAPVAIGIASILIVSYVKHSSRLSFYQVSIPSIVMYFLTILVGVGYSYINFYGPENKVFNILKKYGFVIIASLTVVEIASSYRGADNVVRTNSQNAFMDYSKHLDDTKYIPAINALKEYASNDGFYRMETTFNRTGTHNTINNNPSFFSYNGLSHYSSTGKKKVENYMNYIGMQYNNFFAKYDGGSTFSINSLLGVKYLVEDKSNNSNIHPYFLDKDTFKVVDIENELGLTYYQNDYALPLAFTSDYSGSSFTSEGEKIDDNYTYWYDKFEWQNALFKTLNKENGKNVFVPLTYDSFETNIEYDTDVKGIKTYKNVLPLLSHINIEFTVPSEAYDYPLYISEKLCTEDVIFTLDGKKVEFNTYWHKGIYSFKDTTNHKHTLKITFSKAFEKLTLRPELYYEDLVVSKEYLNSANINQYQSTGTSNGMFSYSYNGTINLTSKENKMLVFTIPNENGIEVKVDGKRVDTFTRYNIFTAINLSSFELGEHQVAISYVDGGLRGGFIISVINLLALVPTIIFYSKIENFIFRPRKKDEDFPS